MERGVGVAVGFEPILGNEGFSTDVPKLSVFTNLERTLGTGGFSTDVSVHRVTPRNGLLEHTFLGWGGRAWYGSLYVSHDVQIDRDPESGEWVPTELRVNGSVPVSSRGAGPRPCRPSQTLLLLAGDRRHLLSEGRVGGWSQRLVYPGIPRCRRQRQSPGGLRLEPGL